MCPLGVRARDYPAPFFSLVLLQPLLFHCFFPLHLQVRPENSLALLRPRCSCAESGLGHHSSCPTGGGVGGHFCVLPPRILNEASLGAMPVTVVISLIPVRALCSLALD